MRLNDVMDELGDALRSIPSLQGRTYPHPVSSATPPAAFIPFPETEFDLAHGRGLDRLPMRVVVLVPAVDDRATRDQLLGYVDGAGPESVKAAIEGHTYTAFDSVRVLTCRIVEYAVGDVKYFAAVFPVDVIGSGTTT